MPGGYLKCQGDVILFSYAHSNLLLLPNSYTLHSYQREYVVSLQCTLFRTKLSHCQEFISYFRRTVTSVSSILEIRQSIFLWGFQSLKLMTIPMIQWIMFGIVFKFLCTCMNFWNSGAYLFSAMWNGSSNYLPLKLERLNSET